MTKQKIIDRYNDRFKEYGIDFKTLAVGDMERQFVRYSILTEIGDVRQKKILDIGCGFGDYYGFLLSNGIYTDYTGYDINKNFIDGAKQKYPSGKFEIKDFFSEKIKEKFDIIVSSSSFNNKFEELDNYTFVKKLMKKSYNICNEGVAINFMTSYVDYKLDHGFYYEPEKIFKICKDLTNRVTLRHDYCLYEFTVYLYKSDCSWKKRSKKND